MIYINYLYFLIITFYGVKFLYSKAVTMRHPLDRTQTMTLDGPEAFLVLTFSTGLLALNAPAIGVDLMAFRLLVLETLCVLGMFVSRNRPVWSAALVVYAIYLLWLVIGCFYSPSAAYGARVVLKYIYPFLLCLFASAAVRYPEVFLKAGLTAVAVAFVCIVFDFVPGIGRLVPGVVWYATAQAIHFISIMIFCLALAYFSDAKRKYLILSGVFLLPCFIWVFRTSIMGSGIALAAFYFIKYRLRSLPILFGLLVAGVVAVFTIPSLHDKMFQDDESMTLEKFQEGKVTMDNVDTNGRKAMWEYMDKHFYQPHKLTGTGTGASQNYFYSNYVFGGIRIVHSDFVQMKCDNGLIGLVLYSLLTLLAFLHCFRTCHSSGDVATRMCALVAGASLVGVFATCYSDNNVNYSMATLSMPWGFYGMMLGLTRRNPDAEEDSGISA